MTEHLDNTLPFEYNNIIIFKNGDIAQYFLETLYLHKVNLIVMSADGLYPKNKEVANNALYAINNNDKINVFMVGSECFKFVPDIKTRKIFLIDHLLFRDLRTKEIDKLNLSPSSFMHLIDILCKSRSVSKSSNQTIYNDLVARRDCNPFEYDRKNNRLVSSWKARLLGCNETLEVENCNFDIAKKVWSSDLWKDRDPDDIKPVSTMTLDTDYNITYDMEIKHTETYYFVVKYNNNIIGINSGHKCSDDLFRSRGLWTHPDWRKIGIGKLVLEATVRKAKLLGCNRIWSFPRKSSIRAYRSVGFQQKSDWTDIGLFGPNCIVEINFNE